MTTDAGRFGLDSNVLVYGSITPAPASGRPRPRRRGGWPGTALFPVVEARLKDVRIALGTRPPYPSSVLVQRT
jgi:hypothetical protein